MTAIWLEGQDGSWSLQDPSPFENEKALHDIVMRTPELLPLSGSPRLTVVGREVPLRGSGYADVVAVESDGRPVIIEVKLRNNAESRRAVIAQALSYAASVHGMSRQDFENAVAPARLGGQSVFETVRQNLQEESLAQSEFESSLEAHLSAGSFRVVIVLDEAPSELVSLMGYLEAVTTGLSLDLIAVRSYALGHQRIAVPQRLDPEQTIEPKATPSSKSSTAGHLEDGVAPFRGQLEQAPEQFRNSLTMLADWAEQVGHLGGVHPRTFFGKSGALVLLPRFTDENVGLVSLWMNPDGSPSISFWRSVFERRAPSFIEPVERLIAPKKVGQGNTTNEVTEELLHVLTQAYEVAVAPVAAEARQ